MKWEEYIEYILDEKTALDELLLSSAGEAMPVSPIVKASVLMLESELQSGSRHNVFVYPDTSELCYEFLIAKTVFNITVGKIKYSYDPHLFIKGQKLSYNGCVVVFEKCESNWKDGRERIGVSFSNGNITYLPIEIAPVFQLAESKRVSTEKRFYERYSARKALKEAKEKTASNVNDVLAKYKTHLDGSIFFVSKMNETLEYLSKCYINDKPISDCLYIGKTNYKGEITNAFSGQMKGNPAIIVASDLYSAAAAVEKGVAVQSFIINLSNSNILNSQLDVLDELSDRKFPIACICNTNSSFELEHLSVRDYSIWRWDSSNITPALKNSSSKRTSNAIKNCISQNVEYVCVENDKLSSCINTLNEYKNHINNMQNEVIDVHERLFSLSINMLRSVNPSDFEERAIDNLVKCLEMLDSAKKFIAPQTYQDFQSIISTLDNCVRHRYSNPKFLQLKTIISSKRYRNICLVIPSRFDKQKTDNYWKNYILKSHLAVVLTVMYPEEYILSEINAEVTIISGWLGKKHMNNMLYSYRTEQYMILEYKCEEHWEKSHKKNIKRILKKNSNLDVLNKYIKNKLEIPEEQFDDGVLTFEPNRDELDEIEIFIKENQYRQYSSAVSTGNKIEAIPVSFVGGYISFFGMNHSVISVTGIVSQESEKIDIVKDPLKLSVGDFIAVRESDRDIITEIANKILENNGKAHLHGIARRWKDALELETLFSTEDEIVQKLRRVGCTRGETTIKNWISHNEDYIAPKNKQDLAFIAEATEDSVLKDTLDDVFYAARIIKGTHQQAGMYLSEVVKTRISNEIERLHGIDAFNVWDPIELELEGIGTIKILKIIDIGERITVPSSIVNRLIEE